MTLALAGDTMLGHNLAERLAGAPPTVLRYLGVGCVTLANDHALDYVTEAAATFLRAGQTLVAATPRP